MPSASPLPIPAQSSPETARTSPSPVGLTLVRHDSTLRQATGPAPVRVAIQSGFRLLRDSLANSLANRPEFTVVGTTARCADLFQLCELRRPDALLLVMGRPVGHDPVEPIAALHDRYPGTTIVVAYDWLPPQDIARAYRAGATRMVPNARGLEAIFAALRARPVSFPRAYRSPLQLTERELEIISLIGAGHNVHEIAGILGISPWTVENHKRRIYEKLGVHSQAHAIAHAAELGLLATRRPTAPLEQLQTQPEPGHATLALIRGQAGPLLDEVTSVLLANGLPYTIERGTGPVPEEHPVRVTRGRVVGLLVDPEPEDWRILETFGIPVVLIRSDEPDQNVMAEGVLRGANAIVAGRRVREELMHVLTLVAGGYMTVSANQARAFIRALCHRSLQPEPDVTELTPRESDILHSIARGHSVRQTARALGISVKTVENTQARLFRKLGVRNRAGALAVAHGLGLMEETRLRG